jgi:hypothetical protein
MAIVVSRSESGMSLSTSFAALDNLAGASVSSSFTVPQGVSAIKQISISMSNDANEETIGLCKVSGNAMRDGDAVFTAAAMVVGATATGTSSNNIQYDTDLGVVSGNSVELSLAGTTAATVDAAVTVTFA